MNADLIAIQRINIMVQRNELNVKKSRLKMKLKLAKDLAYANAVTERIEHIDQELKDLDGLIN